MKSLHLFNASFYIRKNKNKIKDYSIYCCIKVNETSNEICVSRSILKTEWDMGKARPKQTNDHLLKLSIYLDTIKSDLFKINLDLKIADEECSAKRIKTIYLGKDPRQFTFLQLMDKAIEKYKHELAKGSLKNYYATRSYVKAFCNLKFKSGDISLKLLNYNFIDELKTYILSNPLRPNDPCANNGCMKHMERIKKMVTWAYEMRFIDHNVFASFKIKKKPFTSKRLSWEQLKKIEQREFHRPILNLVKDLFVFCCYTGMAPGDLQNLRPHQIHSEPDGVTWLTYSRAKSNVEATVPLLSLVIALIKKHECKKGDIFRDTIFPLVTNKDLNQNLKVISELCELGIQLNFYTARHSFATTVTLSNGVPITSIKKMMGHLKIESTVHYAQTEKSVIKRDMMLLQERINLLDFHRK